MIAQAADPITPYIQFGALGLVGYLVVWLTRRVDKGQEKILSVLSDLKEAINANTGAVTSLKAVTEATTTKLNGGSGTERELRERVAAMEAKLAVTRRKPTPRRKT